MKTCILAALLCFGLASCNTVTPDILPPAKAASFDGNEQNSGFVGFTSDGSGIITAHARDRYNVLLKKYDAGKPDAGLISLPTGNYLIDKQHLVTFVELNRKYKSAIEK